MRQLEYHIKEVIRRLTLRDLTGTSNVLEVPPSMMAPAPRIGISIINNFKLK